MDPQTEHKWFQRKDNVTGDKFGVISI